MVRRAVPTRKTVHFGKCVFGCAGRAGSAASRFRTTGPPPQPLLKESRLEAVHCWRPYGRCARDSTG